jgi:protein tyrosine phosphatase (PTP) superfamily phosphohydrolase (DUF442 family)
MPQLSLLAICIAFAGAGGGDPPAPLDLPGIENVFRLDDRLYSGGEPRGSEDFARLQKLGIKTVLSVDGTTPDVAAAKEYGLRYVHLPIGYDGIPARRALEIAKAAKALPGPLYVHCHHGKHRGPAAAAIIGIADRRWSQSDALAWLAKAGTSPEYAGLFRCVREFSAPDDEVLADVPDEFPERAEVPDLVEAMVQIDGRWEILQAIRKAGGKAPADHPDVVPEAEALLLAEHYRELIRLDEVRERGEPFAAKVRDAEANALRLRDLLRSSDAPDHDEALANAFKAAENDCKRCHAAHRN